MKKIICTKLLICFALNILLVPAIHTNSPYLKQKKRTKKNKTVKKQKRHAKLEKKRSVAQHLRNQKKAAQKRKLKETLRDKETQTLLTQILKKLSKIEIPKEKALYLAALLKETSSKPCPGVCTPLSSIKGVMQCCEKFFSRFYICYDDPHCWEMDIAASKPELVTKTINGLAAQCFQVNQTNFQCVTESSSSHLAEIIIPIIATTEMLVTLAIISLVSCYLIKHVRQRGA